MGGLRGGYNALRDRLGSSISTAPISFVKVGPDEYKSKDGLWTIHHNYKSGWQAHHEWRVTAPDGSRFARFTQHYYGTLSGAVAAINEAVAYGPIGMLSGLYARLKELEQKREEAEARRKLRMEREARVLGVLIADQGIDSAEAKILAPKIVDQLFGVES